MSSNVCDKPYTSTDKWITASIVGLLFLILASPFTFHLLNKISSLCGVDVSLAGGSPTVIGLLVGAGIFTLVLRGLMSKHSPGCNKPYTSKDKWVVAIIGGLLYLLIASPFLYDAFNRITKIVGLPIASPTGTPTVQGLVIHTLVFVLLVRLLMR